MIDILPQDCHICEKNPGPDPRNPHTWAGFLDQDMAVLVCYDCKIEHYRQKSLTKHRNLYSEMPVILKGEHQIGMDLK